MKATFIGHQYPDAPGPECIAGFTIGKVYDVEKSGLSWLVTDDDGYTRFRPESEFEPRQGMLHGVVYRITGNSENFHFFEEGTRVVLFQDDGDGTFNVVSLSRSGPRSQWIVAADVEVDPWQHL